MKQFFLVCFILTVFASMPVLAAEPREGTLPLLAELDIMQGDPDGNLRLDDPVTRAEFTKIAVATSPHRNNVAKSLSISPFPDVTYQHWAAPYVRVGVTNGIISGYPDASFHPDDSVLLEEGVTMMLRVLGYTDEDFGISWPSGQLGLAQNLDMTDDISCSAGDVMNRRQVAQLVYNTLITCKKGTTSQLLNDFDVQLTEDVTLIADCNDDASIDDDEVFTSAGTYKLDVPLNRNLLGVTGDIAIRNGNKLLAFLPESGDNVTEDYVVYSIFSDTIMAYRDGVLQSIEIDDSSTVYQGKNQMTFGNLKGTLSLGDILRVKQNGRTTDYIILQEGTVKGPLTIRNANWGDSLGVTHNTTVMRDGRSSSVNALEIYDIAYYLSDIDMVLAYSNKINGIYEKATPNKDMPSSITVSGTEYPIEGSTAFQKLGSGGEFILGDTVTLLLGKDGSIADVISLSDLSKKPEVGYLLDCGRKEYQSGVSDTYSGYYITLVLPNGESVEYTTNKNYSSSLNKIVEVTFVEGNAVLSTAVTSLNRKLSGIFSWEDCTLSSYSLSPEIQILDVGTTDSLKVGIYAHIFPQRLDGVRIDAADVLYYELDNNGSLSKLILNNVTNDSLTFGIVTTATSDKKLMRGSYQYLVNGQLYSLSTTNRILNISAGQGVMLSGNPSNPDQALPMLELSDKITRLTSTHLVTEDKSFPISPDVAVYRKRSMYAADYTQIPLSDIIGQKNLDYSAYYNKPPSTGGQIRIIVVYD